MKWSLRRAVVTLSILSTVAPMLVMILVLSSAEDGISSNVQKHSADRNRRLLRSVTIDSANLCNAARKLTATPESVHGGPNPGTVEVLRSYLKKTQFGETGTVSCYSMKDGTLAISPNGVTDGQHPEKYIPDLAPILKDIREKAPKLPAGEVYASEATWKGHRDTVPKKKLLTIGYVPEWEWAIIVSANEDELNKIHGDLTDEFSSQRLYFIGYGSLISILFALLSAVMIRYMTAPLPLLAASADTIAAGNLGQASHMLSKARSTSYFHTKEVDSLLGSLNTMTETLVNLIGRVQRSGIEMTSSATEIAASARQLEASATEQAASTRDVGQTTGEISETSSHLNKATQTVAESVRDAADNAGSGQRDLNSIQESMGQLVDATSDIAAKLNVINEKTDNIGKVVGTITNISTQTNLLSLNAAIEAEKAGEYGRGFSVVAREISRLADRSAAATSDIKDMVEEMQFAVNSGVMEMDKFREKVRNSGETVGEITEKVAGVINLVSLLAPRFEELTYGVESQHKRADKIQLVMTQLTETADQSRNALEEFNKATGRLNGVAQELREEITQFKI